ncbi:MAG: hypothetical protein ACRDJE_03365 [Dehalococcoidia bacterium]
MIDASVLVAAAGSPTGGSAVAIDGLSDSPRHQAMVSLHILDEAHRSTRRKLSPVALDRLLHMLRTLRPQVAQLSGTAPPDLPRSVAATDHHVIDCCLSAGASICLTLDRRHLLTAEIRQWGLQRGLRFLTPGEYLAAERAQDEAGLE